MKRGDKDVPLIDEQGNVSAHIYYGENSIVVHCCDKRHDDLTVEVIVNLLTLLVDGYGEPAAELPTPQFLIEAVQYCVDNHAKLQSAWQQIQREDFPL